MGILNQFRTWLAEKRPKPLNQLLSIEFDEKEVRVIVLERLEPDWNQSFFWEDVIRVCFKDGGMYQSDIITIELKNLEKPIVTLIEAKGGNEFFGALCDRGLFPEEVWRKAIGETGGAVHCWPPKPDSA